MKYDNDKIKSKLKIKINTLKRPLVLECLFPVHHPHPSIMDAWNAIIRFVKIENEKLIALGPYGHRIYRNAGTTVQCNKHNVSTHTQES